MGFEDISLVLEQLSSMKDKGCAVMPLFYYEPTIHPGFLRIFGRMSKLGLIPEYFFMATNGAGLARRPDEEWQALKSLGFDWLSFTLYGFEESHDRFAGRKGSYQDIMQTIERANAHEINWYAGVLLHKGNVSEVETLVPRLKEMGAKTAGVFPAMWQGRAMELARLDRADIEKLPERLRTRFSGTLLTEREIKERILADDAIDSRTAAECSCKGIVLEVEPDLSVYTGASCDEGGLKSVLPGFEEHFRIGSLKDEPLSAIVDHYIADPPPVVRMTTEVTWKELAERYADPESDALWFETDQVHEVISKKWLAEYVRERLEGAGRELSTRG
jgi:MoaA/NifB/PqqE/SkfB family radical SAM enzyme